MKTDITLLKQMYEATAYLSATSSPDSEFSYDGEPLLDDAAVISNRELCALVTEILALRKELNQLKDSRE